MRVVNTSPLIVLARLSMLELLRETNPRSEVVVPGSVLDEVMRGEPDDHAVAALPQAAADWIRVIPTPTAHPRLETVGLDAGEIAVLSIALYTPGCEVVLDDKAARREANRLEIPCIGTVGLILDGHRLGLLPSVRDALESLREAGLYISDGLFRLALEQAGE